MSISVMVLEAKDEFEEKFFIPLVGIDLAEEDFPFVLEELSKIKD